MPVADAADPDIFASEPSLREYRRILADTFGYDSFRDGQADVLQILSNSDVLAVMPTGGGKSMCYVLPALAHGRTLVVSPLIALMQDQVESLQADGVRAAYINSQQARDTQNRTYLDFVNRRLDLLYVAPERFANDRFVSGLSRHGVELLAIDEAHCISEWGHDFRPDYLGLGAVRERLGMPRTLALTATADPQVRQDIVERLALPDDVPQVITPVDRHNLKFSVHEISRVDHREGWLLEFLKERRGRAGIVYTRSRRNTEALAEMLKDAGMRAAAYHAGLSSADRARVQRMFFEDRVDVIVATVAFGLGVDKPDVRFVLHFNMPGRLESYYQEAGRAGRDGEPAECVLLHSERDVTRQQRWIRDSHPDDRGVRSVWQELLAAGRGGNDSGVLGIRSVDTATREDFAMALAALRHSGLIDPSGSRLLSDDPEASISVSVVERHRQHAENRLRKMVEYAESGSCRRAIILRYFGEEPPDRCTGCDNCMRHSAPQRLSCDPDLLEQVLEARERLAGQYHRDARDMFRSRTARELATYRPRSHDELLRIHGIGRTRARWFGDDLLAVVSRWEQDNPDAAERPDILSVGSRRGVMERRRGGAQDADVPDGDPVLQRLKAWRRDLAEREGVPAFTILWDRTLRALAARRPQNISQLWQVWGMGEARIARFGAELISVIRGGS